MNLQNIIKEIEAVDPEIYERLDTRRSVMKQFANLGGKLALAAVPFAFGSMLNKAYGQTPGTSVVDTLQFALKLEYLEAEFYTMAVDAPGLQGSLTGAARTAYTKIKNDEVAHVAFLKTAITSLNATPAAKPGFDFTGGSGQGNGPFSGAASPFNNYAVLLAMAQTFEDTGVRAYKGQAGNLMSNNDVLTAALNIHSVEARHASHIRYMRRNYAIANGAAAAAIPAGVTVKPWITLNQSGIDFPPGNAAIQLSYNGEQNTTQATVNILTVGGNNFTAASASAAFDEILTKDEVSAIVAPFIAP
jgi:hypothetical protein